MCFVCVHLLVDLRGVEEGLHLGVLTLLELLIGLLVGHLRVLGPLLLD